MLSRTLESNSVSRDEEKSRRTRARRLEKLCKLAAHGPFPDVEASFSRCRNAARLTIMVRTKTSARLVSPKLPNERITRNRHFHHELDSAMTKSDFLVGWNWIK